MVVDPPPWWFINHPQDERTDDMLVLSRKVGETIMIGDGIEVMVVEINGGRIKLGIAAPREVPILRSEIIPKGTTEEHTECANST